MSREKIRHSWTELFFPSQKAHQDASSLSTAPLAERMRPRRLEDVLGQDHLLEKGKLLREVIRSQEIPSMIFWGPPGVGKTTLARIIAQETDCLFCLRQRRAGWSQRCEEGH